MKTKFNASSTVGICTNCADVRGPGCACDSLTSPCDEGFCWGEDTGPGNVSGTCYQDPPPSFACLANCEALLGNGAFCMTDHQDGARCVPQGTSNPEAYNCWMSGGYLDPELGCTTYECGPLATNNPAIDVSCQDIGYPATFSCDNGPYRCMPTP